MMPAEEDCSRDWEAKGDVESDLENPANQKENARKG